MRDRPIVVHVESGPGWALVTCSEHAPSLNEIVRMLPLVRSRQAKRWRRALGFGVRARGRFVLAPPVRITATYVWSTRRRRDLWNYPPKWAVDGLVDAGLIPDDDADAVADCRVRFAFDRERPRMELLVEQITTTEGTAA